jgi:hypothetical protein
MDIGKRGREVPEARGQVLMTNRRFMIYYMDLPGFY